MIQHIAVRDEWERARSAGLYRPPSLETEGFVHASTPGQVLATANRLFPGRRDLVLLSIDPARLPHEVRYEDLYGEGEAYPHVYGPIPLEAVTRADPWTPDADGVFRALP